MSLYSYPIGREAPILKRLTGTGATILCTAGSNGLAVVGLRIAEMAAATPTVTLDIHNGTSVVAEVAHLRAFTAKEIWNAVTLDGVPILLDPGQSLRATASAANQLDVTGVKIEPPQTT